MGVDFLRSQKTGKIPLVMYILDILLAIIISSNMWAFLIFIQDITYIYDDLNYGLKMLYILFSAVYISVSTILTMMTIHSAKKEAWRAAARRLLIIGLVAFSIEYLNVGYQLLLFEHAMAIVIVGFIILFLPNVRKYYTPPLSKDKGALAWVRYILIKPKDWDYVYVFKYDKNKDLE